MSIVNFLKTFWANTLYFNQKIVAYEDRRLLLLFACISSVFPAWVIMQGIEKRSYQSHLSTDYLFSIGSAQTLVQVDDMIVGDNTTYDLESLAIRESPSAILVPTRVQSALQVYQDCENNSLNPGVPCTSDYDCNDFYEQQDARCDSEKLECRYNPYRGWCVTNISDTNLYNAKNMLDLYVTARIMCSNGQIFSNYNRMDKAHQKHWHLRAYDLLRESNLHTKSDYSEWFERGVSFLVVYHWTCNLDNKEMGRYDCPMGTEVKVLSNSSIISSKTVTYLSTAAPGQNASRQVQTVFGFRFEFVGRGGCFETTTLSVLAFLASLMALQSAVGLLMASVVMCWKMWYGAPVFGEVYKLAKRASGKGHVAVLHNNSVVDSSYQRSRGVSGNQPLPTQGSTVSSCDDGSGGTCEEEERGATGRNGVAESVERGHYAHLQSCT